MEHDKVVEAHEDGPSTVSGELEDVSRGVETVDREVDIEVDVVQ